MNNYEKQSKWFALFVTTGEEDKVKEIIHLRLREELKAFVPKRNMRERKGGKWHEKIRTLFPGYVMLNGQINSTAYNLISSMPGVIRFLKDKDGLQEIQQSEIWLLQRLMSENEIIKCSSLYIQGDRVEVIDGPLFGLEGYITEVNKRKGRVKVSLSLLGQPRTVELCVTMLQPA